MEKIYAILDELEQKKIISYAIKRIYSDGTTIISIKKFDDIFWDNATQVTFGEGKIIKKALDKTGKCAIIKL